jgi:hypothetical protein
MTRILSSSVFSFVLMTGMDAVAQDSAPRSEDRSSRERVATSLQEKLNAIGAVDWTETQHMDTREVIQVYSQQMGRVIADASTCKLTFTVSINSKNVSCPANGCGDARHGFATHVLSLAEIGTVSSQPLQNLAENEKTITPMISKLDVQMKEGVRIQSCSGSAPSWHRVECTPAKWTSLSFIVRDEETSKTLVAAFEEASEVCRKGDQ